MEFDGPHEMRRLSGALRFEARAALKGMSSTEFLKLMAYRGVRVNFRLYGPCSTTAVAHFGVAAVEFIDDTMLRCRFTIPIPIFGDHSLRVLYIFLSCDGVDLPENFGICDAWMAVGVDEGDPFKRYFKNFNADRI